MNYSKKDNKKSNKLYKTRKKCSEVMSNTEV